MKNLKLAALAFLSIWTSVAVGQNDNSLLWKVSGNGLESASYLYGTIHLVCPDDMDIPTYVEEAMDASEQLVLELDMDDPSTMQKMQQMAINPGMKNIADELSEEDRKILDEFFTEHYQMNMQQLGVMRPITLISMMFITGLDCQQPGSYELHFMEEAKSREWEVEGLEAIEDQLAIFDSVPAAEQLSWVVEYARDHEKFKTELADLISAYKAKDVDAVYATMEDYPEYEGIEDELLTDRNVRWIPLIEAFIKEKPTFIAVGAAHLGSETGVIELLREAGYTVEPVL